LLCRVTPEEACAHPNWVMGRKISVDSATMMNKALEVIEARYLFGLPPERLEVVIHPQSVIHSMVQYHDKSVVAQLGTPDMRVPIAYGLAWPDRVTSGAAALDFHTLADMSFESMDSRGHPDRFPGLALAWEALRGPAGTTAVLNAANEVAVAAFLDRRIRFDQIHHVNLATLSAVCPSKPGSLEELLGLDAQSRGAANTAIGKLGG
jgi:1-deoxy-D-xylulose-5-phosphate reductoisomerase